MSDPTSPHRPLKSTVTHIRHFRQSVQRELHIDLDQRTGAMSVEVVEVTEKATPTAPPLPNTKHTIPRHCTRKK